MPDLREDQTGKGRLTGRRILLTGAAGGVGAATARLFAKEGAKIALLDRNRDGLDLLAAETGGTSVEVDLLDPTATGAAVDRAAEALGGLDGIVNNAGISISRPFPETDLDTWRLALDGNLTSTYLVCHAALRHFDQSAATIVNVSSAVALKPLSGRSAYAASKAGVIAFTKVLAVELAPRVRCNVICPGAVDTAMVRDVFVDPAAIDRIESLYALQRMAKPEEIADAILYLTGPESSFVTGSTLIIDGGRTFQ